MTTFTSPLSPRATALSCAAWPAGLLLPGWPKRSAQSFSGSAFTACLTPAEVDAVSGHGYVAAAIDSAGNGWALSSEGTLDQLVLSGTPVQHTLPQSGGLVYVAAAAIGTNVYAIERASGRLFETSANGAVVEQPALGGPSTQLVAASGTLYALQPTGPAVKAWTPATSGSSTLTPPLTAPSVLAASGTCLAVAGCQAATLSPSASGFALTAAGGATLAAYASPEQGTVTLLTGTDPVWTHLATATGLSGPIDLAWTPDGSELLVACGSSLAILSLEESALIAGQSFNLTAPGRIAITPDGQEALVCQPGSNALATYSSSVGVWSAGASVAVPTPADVLALTSILGLVLSGPDLITLARTGSAWAIGTTQQTLSFPGTRMLFGPDGTLFVVGTAGGQGYCAALTPTYGLIGQTSWTGSADSLAVVAGQVFVLDVTSGLIRGFAVLFGQVVQQRSQAAPAGARGLAQSAESIWCSTTANLQQLAPTAPFVLAPVPFGKLAVWNGAWTAHDLGVAHEPAALTFDPSGNLWCVTRENDLYEFSLQGSTLKLLAQSVVPPPTGQNAGVTLGLSAIAWSGQHLWGATADSGVVVELA